MLAEDNTSFHDKLNSSNEEGSSQTNGVANGKPKNEKKPVGGKKPRAPRKPKDGLKQTKLAFSKKASPQKKNKTFSDSEDDVKVDVDFQTPQKKRTTKSKKLDFESDSDSPPKKKPAQKKQVLGSDSESDIADVDTPPKKSKAAPAGASKASQAKKKFAFDESDSGSPVKPVRKGKAKKLRGSDSESDDEFLASTPSKSDYGGAVADRGRRNRQQAKYVFDDDSEGSG